MFIFLFYWNMVWLQRPSVELSHCWALFVGYGYSVRCSDDCHRNPDLHIGTLSWHLTSVFSYGLTGDLHNVSRFVSTITLLILSALLGDPLLPLSLIERRSGGALLFSFYCSERKLSTFSPLLVISIEPMNPLDLQTFPYLSPLSSH